MINWIIGGSIILFAGYILVRMIRNAGKGQCTGCSHCSYDGCDKKP